MQCLDDAALARLAADADEDREARAHVDGCATCSAALAARRAAQVMPTVDPLAGTAAPGVDPLAATTATQPGAAAAAPVAPAFADGDRLGRYAQLARLGAGAMGVVYAAHDEELGRRVALKLLKRPDPELTVRLKREARAMAQVTHPNVVAVYEVSEAAGATFIAMELVEGTSLRAWQQAPRTIVELIAAYAAAGRGLAAAHAAGIVHRDFKPDNVLVGADGRVRVTDFGLASAQRSSAPAARSGDDDLQLTQAGSVLGTPSYMAPEQFTGGNLDARTDQFAFCVALYEALYGARPFAGKSFVELGENVCDGRMAPAPARSRVSSALRAILVRGLSVKPGDRFPTMEHLLAELGRDRARPWRRTARALGAAAAGLALWLAADLALRDRAEVGITEALRLTGAQTTRTLATLQGEFFQKAGAMKRQAAVGILASHRDQADFGLGGEAADRDDLTEIHSELESSTLPPPRGAGSASAPADPSADTLAIVDAKGRLMFSQASAAWGTSVASLTQVKRAIDAGDGADVVVMAYDDPALVAAHLFDRPRDGLAVIYDLALSLGADDKTAARETRAVLLEVVDGTQLLDNIRLDADMRLALVAPDGRSIGDAPAALIAAAPAPDAAATTVAAGDQTYKVQTIAIPGFDGQGAVARVVMANPIAGLTLFPHARAVFALLLALALGGAAATGLRARQIARA